MTGDSSSYMATFWCFQLQEDSAVNTSQQLSVLWQVESRQLQRLGIHGTVQLHADGSIATDCSPAQSIAVIIQPVVPQDLAIAVAHITSVSPAGLVAVNGVPAACGLHVLRHADRLDVADCRFWISAEFVPERTRYAPATHGVEVRCCLTQTRLCAGQDIVICPGVPGTCCGAVYTARAWDTLVEQNPRMKCPRCGYRPTTSVWQPPPAQLRGESRHEFDAILRSR